MPPLHHAAAPPHGRVVWLTGLSAAGKTTLARGLEELLRGESIPVYRIDGDDLRRTVSAGLGFSPEDRAENVRRAAALAGQHADEGAVCVVALISPLRAHRAEARRIAGAGRFLEVHVATPVSVCRARDPKGLYARADRGELRDFTGVSAPYEPPLAPDLVLHPDSESLAECIARLHHALRAAPPPSR